MEGVGQASVDWQVFALGYEVSSNTGSSWPILTHNSSPYSGTSLSLSQHREQLAHSDTQLITLLSLSLSLSEGHLNKDTHSHNPSAI
jgi:hypothetical protein